MKNQIIDPITFFCRLNKKIGDAKKGTSVLVSGPFYFFDERDYTYEQKIMFSNDLYYSQKKNTKRLFSFKIFSYINKNILKKHDIKSIASHDVFEIVRSPIIERNYYIKRGSSSGSDRHDNVKYLTKNISKGSSSIFSKLLDDSDHRSSSLRHKHSRFALEHDECI